MRLILLATLLASALAATTFTPSKQPFLINQEIARKYAPILKFSPLEQHFPSSMEFILSHSTLKSKTDTGFSLIHPSSMDVYTHSDANYYLELDNDPIARAGHPVEDGKVHAPMYVSAQSYPDYIAITYMFLYPFQPSQLLRIATPIYSSEFIIESFGEHQGDLERITVHLTKDLTRIIKVNFSHHNDNTDYTPDQVIFEGKTHPVVRVGLNAHPSYNAKIFNTSFVQTFDYDVKVFKTHLYAIDVIGDPFGNRPGPVWKPYEQTGGLVLIGLDDEGKVMGNKPWVAYKGRLGVTQKSTAKAVLNIDGSKLTPGKEWLIKTVAKLFDSKIPDEFKTSGGPTSFGARSYVNGVHKK